MTDTMSTRIGRFQILDQIGETPFGSIYRANDPSTGRVVSIETFKIDAFPDGGSRDQVIQDARRAGAITHPNLVTTLDLGTFDESVYIATELVTGTRLNELIRDSAPFEVHEIAMWIAQIADVLHFLNRSGIVHGGLQPASIILTQTHQVKVDGTVSAHLVTSTTDDVYAVSRDPSYMAPEQVKSETADHRTDIYALAAITYELLTGRRPFTASTIVATAFKVASEAATPPRDLNPSIAEETAGVLMRGLAKEPSERFPSAVAFADALRKSAPGPAVAEAGDDSERAGAAVSAQFCDQCGARLKDGVKFCFKCGAQTLPLEALESTEEEERPITASYEMLPLPIVPEEEEEPAATEVPADALLADEEVPQPAAIEETPMTQHEPTPYVPPTEVVDSSTLPPIEPVTPGPALPPPLAAFSQSRKGGELPPPGTAIDPNPTSKGRLAVLVPVVVIVVLMLLFALLGFLLAPRFLGPQQPAPTTSSAALFER